MVKDHEWTENEVGSIVCGDVFGEGKVNNSLALLSRFWSLFQLVKFSVRCCSSLCLCLSTPARKPDGTVMQPSCYLFFSWKVQLRILCHAESYCYARLIVIAHAVRHASLDLFSRPTNTSSVLHALWDCVCSLGNWTVKHPRRPKGR